MPKTLRLNDLQLVLLSNAASRDNGNLLPLPESCTRDTTRIRKAVTSLQRRGLAQEVATTDPNMCWPEEDQDTIGLFITDAGRSAIGVNEERVAAPATPGTGEQAAPTKTASPRPGSKIGAVIALLERKEGATIDEIVDATGWLAHTTRAALTGLRKKGHTITKSRRGEVTCYRIAPEG